MTLENETILDDLQRLTPEEVIGLHLSLVEELLPVLLDILKNRRAYRDVINAMRFAVSVGKGWLKGEITDPDEVLKPNEGPGSPFISGLELRHKKSERYGDIRLLTSLSKNAIWYAAQIQFERVGDEGVPQSLEEEFTNEELADFIAKNVSNASPRMAQALEAAWERRFRPSAPQGA